jgi:transposase
VLADGPRPTVTGRRFPPYASIPDPSNRRHAVVTLHAEGWTPTSIGRYLELGRQNVYQILQRWRDEGVAGLADKSRANTRKCVVDAALKQEIRQRQENPELGEWRMHAALKQIGIQVSPATCGRIMAENRQLYDSYAGSLMGNVI